VTAYSTITEALLALDDAKSVIERLPVAGQSDLGPALSAAHRLELAVRATLTVAPAEAVGTVRYRTLHGLPPLVAPHTERTTGT
jgi:hypothetical protein